MTEIKIEMKMKITLIFLIGILVCIVPCLVSFEVIDMKKDSILLKTSNPPIQLTAISSIYATKDAYVSLEDPNLGWGNSSIWVLWTADMYPYSGINRVFIPYFFFDYQDFPYYIQEAGIRLSPQNYDYQFDVKFNLVHSEWDEYNIRYNNRPDYIERNIYHGSVTGWANMTDYIYDRTNISVNVVADFIEDQSFRATGYTREKIYACERCKPRLLLTYSTQFDIIITNPSNQMMIRNGDHLSIRWITVGPIDSVKIELFKEDNFVSIINSSTENDGFYNWTVGEPDNLQGGDYTIKISDTDHADAYEISTPFTLGVTDSFDPIMLIFIGSSIGAASMLTIIIIILRKRSIKK